MSSQDKPVMRRPMTRRQGQAVVYLFLLSTALNIAGLLFIAHQVNASAKTTASQLALCRAGNDTRGQEIGVWQFLIRLSTPPKTAEGRKLIAEFEHHLQVVYAPRNCALLGHGNPPSPHPSGK